MMVVSLPHISWHCQCPSSWGFPWDFSVAKHSVRFTGRDTKVCKTGNYAILDAQVTGISACHLVEVK